MVFSVVKLEQLEAFRQKKAKERLDRKERIQKRLQQLRDQSTAVAGRDTVQKPATKPPISRRQADSLLKDATNRVSSSSVTDTKRELPARAKLIARRLKQSGNADKTSSGRRVTVTLSAPSDTNETRAGQKCSNDVKNSRESTADENIPQVNDVSANSNLSDGKSCKLTRGKR